MGRYRSRITALLVFSLLLFSCATTASASEWEIIRDVLELIEYEFWQPTERQELLSGALRGLLDALGDPFSEYFSPEELAGFLEQVTSQRAGIGIVLAQTAEGWLIQSVIPQSPASRAGIREGDKLIAVEDRQVSDLPFDQLRSLLGGTAGSWATLTLQRGDLTLNLRLQREVIVLPTVEYRMLEGDVGYLRITSFGENTAVEVSEAMQELRQRGMKAILLDLRDNGGGLLSTAIEAAGEFIPTGPVMKMSLRDGSVEVLEAEGKGHQMPIAVLVNSGTASGAEILAGAIRDRGQGFLIGQTTYGKGIMQDLYSLGELGAIKLTTAEFVTPAGARIQGVGLEPDLYIVPRTGGLPFLPTNRSLYPGLQGEVIIQLQFALDQLGLYYGDFSGVYDQATQSAVQAAQASWGQWDGDGVADAWTQMEINQLLITQAYAESEREALLVARTWLQSELLKRRLVQAPWWAR